MVGQCYDCTVVLCSTVAYQLELSACNVQSTGSSVIQDSYCVETLSKSFTHNGSAIPLHLRHRGVEVLLISVHCEKCYISV